uniref:putative C-type lectin domain family 20 member A n=1 Tax=Epinephelus lanceolatus TaxID=310571 RepID=UPI0014479261|nr:putative C-type lectin domain family 20 member A [Epinephelus lanceolatus]
MENMMRNTCALVLLLLLPAVCEGQLRAQDFIHQSQSMSWKEAQAHCRVHYTDLVTIAGKIENQNFVNTQGWIGLYRDNSTSLWKWSRSDEIANFTIWDSNEPKADENCAFKYPSTEKWESDKCSSKHTFLCFNERLVLVKERKTWEQALQHCRALEAVNSNQPATDYQNHRYDLATLHSPDDHKYAREKAKYAPTNEVWTGLRFLAGQWVWVGGERVQYLGMKSCPTLRFCGTLPKNITKIYNIRDCSQKRSFLCYRKP